MMKLLLIDDEIWTRNIIKTFGDWDKHGITLIEEASDGVEGLRLIKQSCPQIVITDMNMPGMNGISLLKILKDDYPQIKIIVVSGYDGFEFTKQAIMSNAIDYILKPIDAQELNSAIDKCVKEIDNLYLSRDKSIYDLAKILDKSIIRMIMEDKKVIERLLINGNIIGISNTLNRLYDNIIKNEIDEVIVGDVIKKVFFEMIEEYFLTIESSVSTDIQQFRENQDEKKSLLEVINFLKDSFQKALKAKAYSITDKSSDTLDQVKTYIEIHYIEHISLTKLSNLFFISKEYLSKAFKARYQKNLMNYIIELRMKKAKSMLEDKDISIKSVGESVGYDDITHFYHVFKSYYHVSPGDMRREA
jgi:two-component system response regulator YesN